MKKLLHAALASFAIVVAASAEDPQPIPADELGKVVERLIAAQSRVGATTFKLELAPERAAGLKVGDVGAIIIPDQRLKVEKTDKADRKNKSKGAAQAVGQLWTSKLSLVDKETVLSNERLNRVPIEADGKELNLAVFALGLEKAGKKGFQLAVYGKENTPLLRVPLARAKAKGTAPLVMTGRQSGEERGVIELTILGRYKAEIPVGKPVS